MHVAHAIAGSIERLHATVPRRTTILLGITLAASAFAQVDTDHHRKGVRFHRATVAGVQIKVVQVETISSLPPSPTGGHLSCPVLQPGTYQVTFEASGFKRIVQANVTLHTGDVLPVNATLEVGNGVSRFR